MYGRMLAGLWEETGMTERKSKSEMDADIAAIRALMAEEPAAPLERRKPVEVTPRPLRLRPAAAPGPRARAVPDKPARNSGLEPVADVAPPFEAPLADVPPLPEQDPVRAPQEEAPVAKTGGGLKARVLGYRPTRRHIVFGGIVLLALLRPWLLVALMLLPIIIVTGLYLAFGYDRFWSGVLRLYQRYEARAPEKAQRLLRRMDAFALRWDTILDRFPEGLVDGLYLPDLNSLLETEARHSAAVDERLARMRDEAGA